MYRELKRTCTAIVLLIKPFVWCRSRCRRRLGLLKLPIIGDGDRKRAVLSIGAVPMTWDNFSIFRTNCAVMCGTRAYKLRGFWRMSAGKWRLKFPKS